MNAANPLVPYINVKLSLLGAKSVPTATTEFADLISALVSQCREKERLLANHLCPANQRIQNFIYDYLQEAPEHGETARLGNPARLSKARKTLAEIEAPAYREILRGALGAEPIEHYTE